MPSKLCPDCGIKVTRKGRCFSCQDAHEIVSDRAYAKRQYAALRNTPKGHEILRTKRHKRKARHTVLINEIKNRPCVDCGKVYHPILMDFDHRPDAVKKYTIAESKLRSMRQLMDEIDKCDLVCCTCHRIRTWNRSHPNEQIIEALLDLEKETQPLGPLAVMDA